MPEQNLLQHIETNEKNNKKTYQIGMLNLWLMISYLIIHIINMIALFNHMKYFMVIKNSIGDLYVSVTFGSVSLELLHQMDANNYIKTLYRFYNILLRVFLIFTQMVYVINICNVFNYDILGQYTNIFIIGYLTLFVIYMISSLVICIKISSSTKNIEHAGNN